MRRDLQQQPPRRVLQPPDLGPRGGPAPFSDIGGALDIPLVAGAGGVQVVTAPIYGIEYYLTQFSWMEISVATGSLTRVEIVVSHAGFPLATFRASQYTKASCCTTIAEAFRRRNLCLGWNSTFTVTVTNNNALAAEAFVNGVFSYIRGYPDPDTGSSPPRPAPRDSGGRELSSQ